MLRLVQPYKDKFLKCRLVHDTKKCGLLYQSLVPRSWRLALPILVETSNAEAHTCMYSHYHAWEIQA